MLYLLFAFIQSSITLSATTLRLPSYKSKIDKPPSYIVSGDRRDIQWKAASSDQQIIKLTPKVINGISSVHVQVLYEGTSPCFTTITASATNEEDEIINVFLAPVHSLQIISKTTSLFIQESKEIYEIQGFDANGNAFHSLDGLSFTYSYDNKIVKRIDNSETSAITLEGIKEGQTQLSFSYSPSISSNTITLTIIEPIVLNPSKISLSVGDIYQVKLSLGTAQKLTEVKLPNEHFHFSSFNNEIVEISDDGKLIGKKAGEGVIQVFDGRSGYYKESTQVTVTDSDNGMFANKSIDFDKKQ
jgi:hypothetical protein